MKKRLFYFSAVMVWALAWSVPSPVGAQGRRPPEIREAEIGGVSYLSLEDVSAAVRGQLQMNAAAQRVDLSFHSQQVQFFMDSDKVIVNGQAEPMDARTIKNNRGVWVPKRFFSSGSIAQAFRDKIDLGPVEVIEKPAPLEPAVVLPKEPVLAPAVGKPAVETVQAEEAEEAEAAEEAPVAAPAAMPHAIRRVVIDPGHGGKDPGAVGSRGTQEKDVNLWMALELADVLRARDFEVLLTRMDDSFIPLAARAALANKYKADVFISVHCNASVSSKLNGFEVYFLSEKASNAHAEAVARQENASLEFEGKKPSNEVQAVLQSLAQNAKINQSAQLGAIIDREVAQKLSQSDLGVKQAAFYVLRGAQMPAVLIELGFLSNKKEERLLGSATHRRKLIKAIESGMVEFDKRQQDAQKKRRGA